MIHDIHTPIPSDGSIHSCTNTNNSDNSNKCNLSTTIRHRKKLKIVNRPRDIDTCIESNDNTKNNMDDSLQLQSTSSHKKSYYERNKERVLSYAKKRYQDNRDKLLAYSKQYQSERKDRVSERNAEYYRSHKESLSEKRSMVIRCECGKNITKGSMAGHRKSKFHIKFVELQIQQNDNTK